jgi:hypothetical protein
VGPPTPAQTFSDNRRALRDTDIGTAKGSTMSHWGAVEGNRLAACPACGYPTVGMDVCAACLPLMAAAPVAVQPPPAAALT